MFRMAWLALFMWLTVAVQGVAQERAPTTPPAQPSAPQPNDQAREFAAAYQRAGSPKVLVYVDVVGVSAKVVAGGAPVTRLGPKLENLLSAAGVQLVPAKPLTDREVEAVHSAGSYAAARVVGKAAGADVVLYARLVEQSGSKPWYTGTCVLADLRRGATLGTHSWDMVPGEEGVDEPRVAEVAAAVAVKVKAQFAGAFPAGGNMMGAKRHVVRLVGGYTPADLADLVEGLQAAAGVKPGSVTIKGDEATEVGRVATVDLASVSELPEVRRLVRRALVDHMGASSSLIDSREGAIGLRVADLGLDARARLLTGGAQTARNAPERERLRLACANAGRPTVVVMVNMGEGDKIVPGERVRVGAGVSGLLVELAGERAERRLDFDPRVLEDCLNRRLQELGINVADASAPQARVLSTAKDRAWTARELGLEVGRASGAGVVITAAAQVVKEGDRQRITVTAWALEPTGGGLIGDAIAEGAAGASGESIAQGVEEVAAQVVAKLAVPLSDRWEAAQRK